MTSFADTLAFCFPAPEEGRSSADYDREYQRLPLHARPNGGGSGGSPSAGTSGQHRFQRPEEPDLTRAVAKMNIKTAMKHYAPDWIFAAVLWACYVVMTKSSGHTREFSLKDISIQHTFAEHERVPPNLLVFISVGIPLLFLVPISLAVGRTRWDLHNAIIGLFMSYTVTGVVTQLVKMCVGRPRPDLIARCQPLAGAVDRPVYGLSTIDICTSENVLRLADGFKSFPSGHSSLSFAGLGFLACYLAGKMHLWDKRGHRTRAWFALMPLLGAIMVAVSRTMDNRRMSAGYPPVTNAHDLDHWQDVLVGSILGLFIAWVSYRTYYPPFKHRQCHLPLAPRDPDAEAEGQDEYSRVRLNDTDEAPNADGRGPNGRFGRPSEEEQAWRSSA